MRTGGIFIRYRIYIVIQWAMTKSGSNHEKLYPVSYRVYHSMAYDTRQNAYIEMQKKNQL